MAVDALIKWLPDTNCSKKRLKRGYSLVILDWFASVTVSKYMFLQVYQIKDNIS